MTEQYDWLTLDEDEEFLWEGQISRKSMIAAYAVGIPLILMLGLGLVVIGATHLRIRHTDYVITNKGVYKKTGILSRSVTEIEYDKVQNTSFSAGPLDRQFGIGTVEISTAGGSGVEMTLESVDDPQDVQKRLSRLVKRVQGTATREDERAGKADVLDDILAELRAIRGSLEAGAGVDSTGQRDRPGDDR